MVQVHELDTVTQEEYDNFLVNIQSVADERQRRLQTEQVAEIAEEKELLEYSFDDEIFEEEDQDKKLKRIKEQKELEEK